MNPKKAKVGAVAVFLCAGCIWTLINVMGLSQLGFDYGTEKDLNDHMRNYYVFDMRVIQETSPGLFIVGIEVHDPFIYGQAGDVLFVHVFDKTNKPRTQIDSPVTFTLNSSLFHLIISDSRGVDKIDFEIKKGNEHTYLIKTYIGSFSFRSPLLLLIRTIGGALFIITFDILSVREVKAHKSMGRNENRGWHAVKIRRIAPAPNLKGVWTCSHNFF